GGGGGWRGGRRGGREGGRRLGGGVRDGGAQFGRLGVRELAVVRLQHGVEELGDRSEDAAETGHAADLLEQRVGFRYGRLGRHVGAVPGRVAGGRDGGRSGDTQDERGAERGGRDTAGGQTHEGSFRWCVGSCAHRGRGDHSPQPFEYPESTVCPLIPLVVTGGTGAGARPGTPPDHPHTGKREPAVRPW